MIVALYLFQVANSLPSIIFVFALLILFVIRFIVERITAAHHSPSSVEPIVKLEPEATDKQYKETDADEGLNFVLENLVGKSTMTLGIEEINDGYTRELQMAQNVQQGLLSVEHPNQDGLDVAMTCIPATNVGGDFYTFVNRDHRVSQEKDKAIPGVVQYVDKRESQFGVIIGDVAGHGIGSALVMALSSGILRETGYYNVSPAETFRISNNAIEKFISNSDISYVTAFYAVINPVSKRLTYAKAGHPAPLLLRANGTIEALEADGLFLGMFDNETYEEKTVQLESGDRLLLYTDGLTEAKNMENEMFGEERLISLFKKTSQFPASQSKDMIISEIAHFCGSRPVDDDRTMVIISVY